VYPISITIRKQEEIEEVNRAEERYVPINLKTICPALIFAARRNDRVIGRTIILTVSIITNGGHNHEGVLAGRRWAIVDLGAFIMAEITSIIHKGTPRDNVNKR